MAQSPWEADLGSDQGRIYRDASAGYVFELGHRTGATRALAAGDYNQILQNATLAGATNILRARVYVRPPSVAPDPAVRWVFTFLVDGGVVATHDITDGPVRTLVDVGSAVANLAAGAHDFVFRLALVGTAGNYEVELPGCAVDDVVEDDADLEPGVINRDPEPSATKVERDASIAFHLVSTSANAPDTTRTTVYVDDIVVFSAGTFSAGWTTSTYGAGASSDVVEFVLTPDVPFASQAVVGVRVVSAVDTGPSNALDVSWSFSVVDETAPQLVSATAISSRRVQIVFSEAVTDTALDAGAYTFASASTLPTIVPDPPTSPRATGTVAGPWAFADGDDVSITIDGEVFEAAVSATAATATSSNAEPFALSDGDTLTLIFDAGATITVVFDDADFADIANALAEEVVAVIADALETAGSTGTVQEEVGGEVTLLSSRLGTSSRVAVTGGTGASAFGWDALTEGTGNVVNAASVTVAELAAIAAAQTTDVALEEAVGGELSIATVRVGPAVSMTLSGAILGVVGISEDTYAGAGGVTSVTRVATNTVVLELGFDDALTNTRSYTVAAVGVLDESSNEAVAPTNEVTFTTAFCVAPEGRRFELAKRLPRIALERDETGDYGKILAVYQAVIDELLCEIDHFPDILDPRIAPMWAVEEHLRVRANPFDRLTLTDVQKRKLALLLPDLMDLRGTPDGIIDAIRLLLGIEVAHYDVGYDSVWSLGESFLGVNSYSGSSDPTDLYAFDIISPVALTAEQRSFVEWIATRLRRAPCHLRRIVEPEAPPEDPDDWELGLSYLGEGSILH